MKGAQGRDLIEAEDRPAARRYRERLLGSLALGPAKGRRLLDFGCGSGFTAEHFVQAGFKVEAWDAEAHPRWKELGRRYAGRLRFKKLAAGALKRQKGRFDVVFCKDVLHHLPDPEGALRQLRRLTRPGGLLAVVEANRLNPVFYVHLTLLGGHEHFTLARLRAILAASGPGEWKLWRREARVWPWDAAAFQNLMDRLQDLAERAPGLGPFLCYHLATLKKGSKA